MCTAYLAASAVGEVVGSLGLVLVWDIILNGGLSISRLDASCCWHTCSCIIWAFGIIWAVSVSGACALGFQGVQDSCAVWGSYLGGRGGKGLIKRELSSLDQFYEECKTSLGYLRVSCTRGAS